MNSDDEAAATISTSPYISGISTSSMSSLSDLENDWGYPVKQILVHDCSDHTFLMLWESVGKYPECISWTTRNGADPEGDMYTAFFKKHEKKKADTFEEFDNDAIISDIRGTKYMIHAHGDIDDGVWMEENAFSAKHALQAFWRQKLKKGTFARVDNLDLNRAHRDEYAQEMGIEDEQNEEGDGEEGDEDHEDADGIEADE